MRRVLVAVTDSPAALAAARVAVELAAQLHGELRALHVDGDGALDAVVGGASRRPQLARRRGDAATAVLQRVTEMAERTGLPVRTERTEGDVATSILRCAAEWPADVIVLGRTARLGVGAPYIGHTAQRVLEFAEQPVLVVPPTRCP
jgi:nucleotide-binding universal stress UspA family protein